jgi:hypothetical protein
MVEGNGGSKDFMSNDSFETYLEAQNKHNRNLISRAS